MRKTIRVMATSLLLAGTTLGGAAYASPAMAAAPALAQAAVPASEEAMAVAMAFLESCVTRDADYVADHSIEDPEGSFSAFGSGEAKISNRIEFADHLRYLKKVSWEDLNPTGFMYGDVAWFADVAYGVLPDGKKLPIRMSLVMRNTDDGWKVVHVHVSEGVIRGGIKKED